MCEDNTPGEKPLCVQWCLAEALIYEEREDEVEEEEEAAPENVEIGLEAMIDRYGFQRVMDTFSRMSAGKKG
jgi:benzoyl-CoA reductase subunit BamC